MKTFAVLTTAALFGFSCSANADNHPSLYAMHATAPAHVAVSVPVAFTEAVAEQSLEVESWMTNENFFAPAANAETEQPLGVEPWMTTSEHFTQTTFVNENEQSLEVENWMLDNNSFSPVTVNEEADKPLQVEDWMLTPATWGK